MVKIIKYCLAFVLVLTFAVPVFAQDDYPKFQLAPGYGNVKLSVPNLEFFGFNPGRHSGFTLDTNYNFKSALGLDLFTGYYGVGPNAVLYTNTFGLNVPLRKNPHIIPFGTAGIGFGIFSISSGSARSMATRIGGGVDIPFNDSLAIRVDATRLGFHLADSWNSGMNISAGVVINLSQ